MAENSTKTGRPFQKGVSGNPGGRPKLPDAFKDIVKDKAIGAINRVIEIYENPDSKPTDAIQAAKIVLEYAYGKPKESMNLTHELMGDFRLVMGDGTDTEA